MTIEEAIRRLENISSHAVHTIEEEPFIMSLDDGIAIKMAIEALEQQPCEDCISRKAVNDFIRSLSKWYVKSEDGKFINYGLLYDDVMFGIDQLPSTTPKEKTGKWIDEADREYAHFGQHIYKCSECGKRAEYFVGGTGVWWDRIKPNFCPNCGAKMEVSE